MSYAALDAMVKDYFRSGVVSISPKQARMAMEDARDALNRLDELDAANAARLAEPKAVLPSAPTDTQRAAARSTRMRVVGHRYEVLRRISTGDTRNAGGGYAFGLTDEGIAKAAGLGLNTVRPRRGELVKMGLVVDSGVRAFTETGEKAIVWRITTEGVKALDQRRSA